MDAWMDGWLVGWLLMNVLTYLVTFHANSVKILNVFLCKNNYFFGYETCASDLGFCLFNEKYHSNFQL